MKPFASNFGFDLARGVSNPAGRGSETPHGNFIGFGSCFGDFARDIVRALSQSGVFVNIFAHLRLFP